MSLELWGRHFHDLPPNTLTHITISPTLTRLLISSRDLNSFFRNLETSTPGTLTRKICLLRDADRCFWIEGLPGIEDDEMLGSLAALVKLHLPSLQRLELHEGLSEGTGAPSNTPDKYEARRVEVEGTSGFVVARSVAL
jgi:hypothetical protein